MASRCGVWSLDEVTNTNNERPSLMRLRKADLGCRVNAPLALRFNDTGLTSFAGLELVRQFFRTIDLHGRLRRCLSNLGLDSDYGFVAMVLLVLALLIVGGRRLRHIVFLKDDPLILRLCGLQRLPAPRTVARWLCRFTSTHLERLLELVNDLAADAVRRAGLRRLTIDVDGSVISTGMTVDWAFRGFNPHHRKVPSYYPITAYEAQTGQILRVKNRPGNIQDGKASVGFLRELFAQLRRTFGAAYAWDFRMDGAFFRRDVMQLLIGQGAEYAIKVPFYTWVGLKDLVQKQRRWKLVDGKVSCFENTLRLEQWDMTLRVVIYRKRVHHETRKNFQLDLFDPADGHYEYSAIATNKLLSGRNLWYFLAGRGSHEKAYAELKSGFAFASVPTNSYGANSAWQILSVLAFNLMNSFQVATTAQRRGPSRKRRLLYHLETIQTMRYKFLNRAGRIVCPAGYPTLDVGGTAAVKARFLRIDDALSRAA